MPMMRTVVRTVLVAVLLSLSIVGCRFLDSVVPDPSSTHRPGLPSPSLEIPPPR